MVFLTYPVALAGLSALTAAGIAAALVTGHPALLWIVLPVVAVLAAVFLWQYSLRPGPETEAPAPEEAEGEEPFIDPVEEADRAGFEPSAAPDGAPPSEGDARGDEVPAAPPDAPPVPPGPPSTSS